MTTDSADRHLQGDVRRLATVDGRTLHSMVLPGPPDAPTVILEAGAAATRSSWAAVQPAAAEFARAIVYDRAGLGRSEPDPVGRTLDRMADDLCAVLDFYSPGPFVLVGHSAGGPIVRLAASRRLDAIAGLVLVDPTDELADVLFTGKFRRAERGALRAGGLLARAKLLPLLYRSLLATTPPEARADLKREAFTPRAMRTAAEQARTFLDELSAWRVDPPDIGTVPVTVVSGARAGDGMSPSIRAAANASHAARAAASSGTHVIAEQSGHYVPLTEPGVVVAEIRRLCDGADR